MPARTLARSTAVLGAAVLLAGPLAAGAQAAPKKKVPTPSVTSKPASPTNARTASFAFSDAQTGVTFQCSLDGAAYAACTSPKSYAGPLGAATHTFRVRARDAGGSFSAAASVSWTVDLTPPPAPALSGVPSPSPTKATGASLTFTDSEAGVTFRCSLDGAVATACTSPRSLSGLADGPHSFTVVARDAAGNVGTAAAGAWTVDTTPPPAPGVTTGPASPTNATTATFGVYEPDGTATLSCSLDGAAYAACTSPKSYAALGEGAHTFDVRAADALGNAASAGQYAWTVDLTAPAPPAILTGPAAVTKTTVGSFTFNSNGATQLRCSLDNAAYADCGSTYDTPALADGSHTLRVLGVDAATNESGATPYTWTVDTTPPPAATVTGPAARTNTTTATFAIGDTEPFTTFTCALDGAPATACTSGASYSALADGTHHLVVTATDQAGNGTPTTFTWVVDTMAPTATAGSVPTVASAALLTFSENVHGVSKSSYALRVSGTTTALAATVTCADLSAVQVSCATGSVRTARLLPSSPLVPGQRYSLVANPGGAGTITDTAGNLLAPKAVAFRAQTTIQENSVATHYAWRLVATASAYGGSYRTEHLAGAAATYPFTGTAITWYTVKAKNQGLADVYVDGVRKTTVNDYAATTAYHVARTVSGLSNAKHVLKIVVRGVKGSTSGTGTYVSIDAVKVGTTLTSAPSFTQTWLRGRATSASGGYHSCADLAGEETSMTFRGTAVGFWTSTARNRGLAKVYLDGALKATYDLYSASTAYNVRRLVSGLTDAVHTIRVVVTGTHRAGATGSTVCLDRWTVA